VSELRRIQKVGYSTLTVSIPAQYARGLKLHEGDSVVVREESDGTLRLIPATKRARTSKASIKADLVENEDLLSRLIVGCYVLGYDMIEITSKNGLKTSYLDRANRTVRRLRGLETVESSENRLLAQSFMDPTKFPVDSLIKRLQLLVSRSLEIAIQAFKTGGPGALNEVRRIQDELDELYWLIVRQLLVALSNREISAEIGLESPLHASGDRVSAKTLEEIGRIILDLTEEMVRLRESGLTIEQPFLSKIEKLARMTQEAFNGTMEGLLAPEIRVIEGATKLVNGTLDFEKEVTRELLKSTEHASSRAVISDLGQIARYCNIIIEIAVNRLLRKTSSIAVIQQVL
jgi:phosphate uptake regulator